MCGYIFIQLWRCFLWFCIRRERLIGCFNVDLVWLVVNVMRCHGWLHFVVMDGLCGMIGFMCCNRCGRIFVGDLVLVTFLFYIYIKINNYIYNKINKLGLLHKILFNTNQVNLNVAQCCFHGYIVYTCIYKNKYEIHIQTSILCWRSCFGAFSDKFTINKLL